MGNSIERIYDTEVDDVVAETPSQTEESEPMVQAKPKSIETKRDVGDILQQAEGTRAVLRGFIQFREGEGHHMQGDAYILQMAEPKRWETRVEVGGLQ